MKAIFRSPLLRICILMLAPVTALAQAGGFHSAHPSIITSDPGVVAVPVTGAGTRLMWLPGKSAVRAGTVTGLQWNADSIGTWSTAFGHNTVARGPYSTSLGVSTRATNQASTALGNLCVASGIASFAAGDANRASGDYSVALGSNSTASGSFSHVFGTGCTASASNATAIGRNSSASGVWSVAIGQSASASGDGSTANGYNAQSYSEYSSAFGYNSNAGAYNSTAIAGGTTLGDDAVAISPFSGAYGYGSLSLGVASRAFGMYSTALGYFTRARGMHSLAAGAYITAPAYGSTALGYYNDTVGASNTSAAVATDPLLYVGNGTSTALSNALLLLKNGNLGLGNVNPQSARLHIKGNSAFNTNPQILVEEEEADYARINFKNTTTTNVWTIGVLPSTVNANAAFNIFWQGTGDVLSLKGNGNATLMGTLTQNSDARLKKNIVPLQSSLAALSLINAYTYQWKDEARDGETQIGVLAQEVKAVFPELVKEDERGTLSVNYSGLVPVLIQALKEQQGKVDAQQTQLDAMQKKLDELAASLKQ